MTELPSRVSTGSRAWVVCWIASLLAAALVMPITCHRYDMIQCWMAWANTTGGARPWAPYRFDGYIYPPLVLYLLTAIRRIEMLTGLPAASTAAMVVIKIPSVLAYAAGAWVCARGLIPIWGTRCASRAALAWVLCFPVWYNAVVWGQWDALLSLVLLIAVVAALRGNWILSGAAIGIGLALKLQAVVILPVLAVYAFRRGTPALAKGALAAAVSFVLLIAPMLLGGSTALDGVKRAYFSSVDAFPRQTVVACNVWMISETATTAARKWPTAFGWTDDEPQFGVITAKQLGLTLFAAYATVILGGLWFFPDPERGVLAAGLIGFGFFMLPTQMHDRYVIPACAMLAVATAAPRGWRYFVAVILSSSANQIVAMIYENAVIGRPSVSGTEIANYQPWFIVISICNLIALSTVTYWYLRDLSFAHGPT
jgi:hypothetical protein